MQWIYAIISMMAYGLFFLSCCMAGFFYYDVNAAKNILITSYCIVKQIVQVKSRGKYFISYEEYRKLIGNKSVFDENELKEKYDTLTDIMLIEILYLGYFGAGNNVNWAWLKNNGYWPICLYGNPFFREIFTMWIFCKEYTNRWGKRMIASEYGHTAWRFWVPVRRKKR